MKPETKDTLNRIRKNRVVRIVAVGALGAIIYTKVMGANGFKMVRPEQFGSEGEVFFRDVAGRICKPRFD